MLKWKDEYSISIGLIDAQHKHLFEIGNNAYELLKENLNSDKYSKIVQVIEDLRQYTKYHFKCEEEYMLKINYINYPNQKEEHDNFIKRIDSYNLDMIDCENQNQYVSDLLLFVFDWILSHILKEDKLIKEE